MLVAQAKRSSEQFADIEIADSEIERIETILAGSMQNVVLVGMPGSGKSSIAEALAEKLQRPLLDSDAEIVYRAVKSIPEIFSKFGEGAFRGHETTALYSLGMQSGKVIATGGGCVTRERNYPLLHQNGTIFWIQRDLANLPTEGRPLSQKTNAAEMYRIRKPLYESFADFIINNDGDPEDALRQITAIWEAQS